MNKSKKSEASQLPVVSSQPVNQVDKLIEMAIDKKLDLDRLQKLLDMKREAEKEVSRKMYYSALSIFQHSVPKVIKNINVSYNHKDGGGKTDYNYADLEGIKDAIRESLY